MIVVDASVVVELVLATSVGKQLAARLGGTVESLIAPHLLDLEVMQALRKYVRTGKLTDAEAAAAFGRLLDLRIDRQEPSVLLRRVWRLRDSMTAYDAAYVALAELANARLLTRDRRLAGAHGHAAQIELI